MVTEVAMVTENANTTHARSETWPCVFFLQTVHSKQANRALKRKELLKRKKGEE